VLIISIVVEAAVAVLAVLAAQKGKRYAYGLAFTFAIYVLYDAARLLHVNVQEGVLSVLFLLAAVSALVAVWGWYRE
jgi:hypothetical protein